VNVQVFRTDCRALNSERVALNPTHREANTSRNRQNATTNKTTTENQKEGKTIMTFRKIAAPVLILSSIALGASAANAGVYNPANDSSPDAMTPGYTGLAKDLSGK
jgi:hypothetical protein